MGDWSGIIGCAKRTLQSRYTPATTRLYSATRSITRVASLKNWDLEQFRQQAFVPQTPLCLPTSSVNTPPACTKWFNGRQDEDPSSTGVRQHASTMNLSFWQQYASTIVPLEITSQNPNDKSTKFERVEAPLELLLRQINHPSSSKTSIYLAQQDLRDLPEPLQSDLPTPDLVATAGRGDLYSSSLWLGKAPTYTPLHRDPNPNLFMQLAGTKAIRLFRPEAGNAIFEHVQSLINASHQKGYPKTSESRVSAAFRGEEMMQGQERALLHDLIWADASSPAYQEGIQRHAYEAILGPAHAMFIPQGWWHTVKGIGAGVTASANWWFR